MARFHLIGGAFEIMDTEHSGDAHKEKLVLGGAFEMPEDAGQRAALEGAAILPAELFDGIGFTPEELKAYPNPAKQESAPAEFKKKMLAARIALHDYRSTLTADASAKTSAKAEEN